MVRVSVRVYGWICVKTCKKSVYLYETFLFYAEVLVFKAAAITVSNDALPYSLDDVMNTLVLHHKITNSKEVNNFPN